MLPVDQRRDWIKSRRRKRKLARVARLRRQVFRLLLLFSILASGVLALVYLPWSTGDGDEVVMVRGNTFTSGRQVLEAVRDCLNSPIFEVDPQELEKRIETLETVKNAFVRRYAFPRPHIIVEVLEEVPWASFGCCPEEPTHAVIAESGRHIPLARFANVISPPLKIYGRANLKLSQSEVKQWGTWVSYIENQCGEPVERVDMRKPFDVSIFTSQLTLKIGAPDITLTQRLARLSSIMPAVRQYLETLEYVDLALDNNIPLKISKQTAGQPASNREEVSGGRNSNRALSDPSISSNAVPM